MVGLGYRPACRALPREAPTAAAACARVGFPWRAICSRSARVRAVAAGAGVVGGLAVAGAGSAAAQGVGPEKLIQTSRQARQAVVRAKGQPMGSYPFLVRCLSAGARDLSGYRPGRQFTLNESA